MSENFTVLPMLRTNQLFLKGNFLGTSFAYNWATINKEFHMRISSLFKSIAALVFSFTAASAFAIPVTFSDNFAEFSNTNSGGKTFTRTILTPTKAFSNGTFTLNIRGDFDTNLEYVNVNIEGFDLGRLFDNVPGNDLFDFATDKGTQYGSSVTTSAIIPFANLASILSDGIFKITYTLGPQVNNLQNGEFLNASISFENASAVPEPTTLTLLGLGVFGLAATRRRTTSKAKTKSI